MYHCSVLLHHKVLETVIQLFKNKAAAPPVTETVTQQHNVAFVRVQMLQFTKNRHLVIYKRMLDYQNNVSLLFRNKKRYFYHCI